jgi:RNA polymerase sigma-54 factor
MVLAPRLELRQGTSLVMTPQLRQAIKLLQFSNMEVTAFVEQELERNPLLERDETAEPDPPASPAFRSGRGSSPGFAEDLRSVDDLAASPRSLREHLGEQLRLGFSEPVDRLIGAHLIALLDPAGRLTTDSAALAAALGTDSARVEAVRAKMKRFEPAGLFCRDLAECLAAQLAERNRLDPAMQTLLENLELLARRDLRRLMRLCGVDADDLSEMIAEIRALDPKPGSAFDSLPIQPLVPDVIMRRAPDGSWVLELNPETMPRVLINRAFNPRIAVRGRNQDQRFLAERLQSANWLVKSLQQRAETILKVAAEIVRRQDGFLRYGVGHLRPLTLRDVAEDVQMHESTISRVTSNKSIATPRGTFELKYFFTTALPGTSGESHSAEAVRQRIRALVQAEQPDEVLSDDAIVGALRNEGVDIARRTVAKYREALRIPSSAQRRREKAVPA